MLSIAKGLASTSLQHTSKKDVTSCRREDDPSAVQPKLLDLSANKSIRSAFRRDLKKCLASQRFCDEFHRNSGGMPGVTPSIVR